MATLVCANLDQRGLFRVLDGDSDLIDVVDIGAVEMVDGFIVNTTADTPDSNPGDGLAEDVNGNTSLRAAIMEFNEGVGAETTKTILLSDGIYALSLAGTIEDAAATGDLDITRTDTELIIVGRGAPATSIDAAGIDRVLDMAGGTTLTLRDLTVTGGNAAGGWRTEWWRYSQSRWLSSSQSRRCCIQFCTGYGWWNLFD